MRNKTRRKLKRIGNILKKSFLRRKYISEIQIQYKPREPMEYICVPLTIKRKEINDE